MNIKKIIKLINDTVSQPSNFRIRNWVEINYESRGAYNDDDDDNMIIIIIIIITLMMIIIITLNLKHQSQGQVYGIIVMHTCLLKEL